MEDIFEFIGFIQIAADEERVPKRYIRNNENSMEIYTPIVL